MAFNPIYCDPKKFTIKNHVQAEAHSLPLKLAIQVMLQSLAGGSHSDGRACLTNLSTFDMTSASKSSIMNLRLF